MLRNACLYHICTGLVMCLMLVAKPAIASDEPRLYVIFDSSASMKFSKPVIADLLEAISQGLKQDSKIRQNVKFYSFRETVVAEETKSLLILSQDIALTILHESDENILPALESIASTPDLNDALVLIFTDGRNLDLANAETEKLMNNLANRRSQFHYFGLYPRWCGREHAIAVGASNMVLGRKGNIIECDMLVNIKNQKFGEFTGTNKLADLAFKTGGMVWPIMNLSQVGRDAPEAPVEVIDLAAEKLLEILSVKAQQSLYAQVTYPKQVKVNQTVYFEVTQNTSDDGVGETTNWRWDFDADGQYDDLGTYVSNVFNRSGSFIVSLELSNNDTPSLKRIIQLPIEVVE